MSLMMETSCISGLMSDDQLKSTSFVMWRVAKGEKTFRHPLYKQRDDGKQISQIHTWGGR